MRCTMTWALLALFVLAGCGEPGSISVTPPPPPEARALLEEVAQSGSLGSGDAAIRESLERLREIDPLKAEALLRDLDRLAAATNPRFVRAKAREMAMKL